MDKQISSKHSISYILPTFYPLITFDFLYSTTFPHIHNKKIRDSYGFFYAFMGSVGFFAPFL